MSKWNRRTLTLRSVLRFKSSLCEIASGHGSTQHSLKTAADALREVNHYGNSETHDFETHHGRAAR
jgi:hypothetical protein